jgi:hypothetical protein
VRKGFSELWSGDPADPVRLTDAGRWMERLRRRPHLLLAFGLTDTPLTLSSIGERWQCACVRVQMQTN